MHSAGKSINIRSIKVKQAALLFVENADTCDWEFKTLYCFSLEQMNKKIKCKNHCNLYSQLNLKSDVSHRTASQYLLYT